MKVTAGFGASGLSKHCAGNAACSAHAAHLLRSGSATHIYPHTAGSMSVHSHCTTCRHLGGGGERSRAVDVDYGGMNFEISQLDAVLEL